MEHETLWRSAARGRALRRRATTVLVALLGASLLLAVAASRPATAAPAPYLDVPADHPYHDAIQDLGERGIIQGFANGPSARLFPMVRRQFAKMTVLTLQLPVSDIGAQ